MSCDLCFQACAWTRICTRTLKSFHFSSSSFARMDSIVTPTHTRVFWSFRFVVNAFLYAKRIPRWLWKVSSLLPVDLILIIEKKISIFLLPGYWIVFSPVSHRWFDWLSELRHGNCFNIVQLKGDARLVCKVVCVEEFHARTILKWGIRFRFSESLYFPIWGAV